MDVRRRLASWALSRPHVLLVDAPGKRQLRWQVEAELDRRRWPVALAPADADLLLVVGEPGPQLAAAVDVLWSQVPAPHHRQDVQNAVDLGVQLDAALTSLLHAPEDASHQDPQILLQGHRQGMENSEHHGGHAGHDVPEGDANHAGHHDMDHDDHAAPGDGGHGTHTMHDADQPAHGGRPRHEDDAGHADHQEHGGHEGHDEHAGHGGNGDHHMHHGGEVAGLPMASTAPDRDGLELDALRVSLGPVLPGWPTGLVLAGSLQGDVLTGAEVSWLDEQPGEPGHIPASAAALDSLARFLLVAGWPVAARRARAARDDRLAADGTTAQQGHDAATRLARTVRRSRTLRWSVRGIGPAAGGGDVLDRVYRWCDAAAGDDSSDPSPNLVGPRDLAALVEGQELAAVRLIVASVDVESAPAHAHHGMSHA